MISDDLILVRKLEREDVDKMELWGEHNDLNLQHYNFPSFTKWEKDMWFKIKAQKPLKSCYAIVTLEDNKLTGYISLRNYNIFSRSAELGIVMDPNHVNKGYGTRALELFTRYKLKQLVLKSLKLHVALYNTRALKCYKKVGFEIKHKVLREFEDQSMGQVIKQKLIEDEQDFILVGNKVYTQYYLMEIKKQSISTKTMDKC